MRNRSGVGSVSLIAIAFATLPRVPPLGAQAARHLIALEICSRAGANRVLLLGETIYLKCV
jgi:hypothetical protein